MGIVVYQKRPQVQRTRIGVFTKGEGSLKANTKMHYFHIFFPEETQQGQNLMILFTPSPYFSEKPLPLVCLNKAGKEALN